MTDIKINFTALSAEAGDLFLWELLNERAISDSRYASTNPNGDTFLVNDSHLALVGYLADEYEVMFFVDEG